MSKAKRHQVDRVGHANLEMMGKSMLRCSTCKVVRMPSETITYSSKCVLRSEASMQLTNLETFVALLVAGSVLVLNVLHAIKLWKDINKPDDE